MRNKLMLVHTNGYDYMAVLDAEGNGYIDDGDAVDRAYLDSVADNIRDIGYISASQMPYELGLRDGITLEQIYADCVPDGSGGESEILAEIDI